MYEKEGVADDTQCVLLVSKEERGVLGFDKVGSLMILTRTLAVSSGGRVVAEQGILRKRREGVDRVHI